MRLTWKLLLSLLTIVLLIGCLTASTNQSPNSNFQSSFSEDFKVIDLGKPLENPKIYGDKIIFVSDEVKNIYLYSLPSGNVKQITKNIQFSAPPDIFENKIAWINTNGPDWDIYLYDFEIEKEEKITKPETDGPINSFYLTRDFVIWQTSSFLHILDISTKELSSINFRDEFHDEQGSTRFQRLLIDKKTDNILLQEYIVLPSNSNVAHFESQLSLYNVLTKKEEKIYLIEEYYGINTPEEFSMNDNKIVWSQGGYIHLYDIQTKEKIQITKTRSILEEDIDDRYPYVEGNLVSFIRFVPIRPGAVSPKMFLYDLVSDKEKEISKTTYDKQPPQISDGVVIWQDWCLSGGEHHCIYTHFEK